MQRPSPTHAKSTCSVAVVLPLPCIDSTQTVAVHMLLLGLAMPAMPAGFLKAFRLAFLLWPFNLALPLARDLPRACITLRGIVSFYAAGLRGYVASARRGVQLLQARSQGQQQPPPPQDGGACVARTREDADAVAHAMLAFDDIY